MNQPQAGQQDGQQNGQTRAGQENGRLPSAQQNGRANLDIFGFTLDDAEMASLAALDQGEGAAVDSDVHEEF